MTAAAASENSSPSGLTVALALVLAVVVILAPGLSRRSSAAARSPISAPLENIDLKRDLLAGSDALLERMVIPPNRPDWVVMDCAGQSDTVTVFDKIRDSLCDLKRN